MKLLNLVTRRSLLASVLLACASLAALLPVVQRLAAEPAAGTP